MGMKIFEMHDLYPSQDIDDLFLSKEQDVRPPGQQRHLRRDQGVPRK